MHLANQGANPHLVVLWWEYSIHSILFRVMYRALKLATPVLEPSPPPASLSLPYFLSHLPPFFSSQHKDKFSVSFSSAEGKENPASSLVLFGGDPPCLSFLLYNKASIITGPPSKSHSEDEIQQCTGSPYTAHACHSGRSIHSSCCRSWCQHAKLDLHHSQSPQCSSFRTLVTMCNYIFVLSTCHSTQA